MASDDVTQLIADLESTDDDTCMWAARDLAELKEPRAVKPLCLMLGAIEDLTSYNWQAKVMWASKALARIADPQALPFLHRTVGALQTITSDPR